MNTKYLIETLIEIPDKDLFSELSKQLLKSSNSKALMIPNLQILYKMFETLFNCSDHPLQIQAILLLEKLIHIQTYFLRVQIEQAWNYTSKSIIRMIGEEDSQVRKKASNLIFLFIDGTNNVNIALEKLYYEGMEDQSLLVMIESIRCCYKILETYTTILHNKTSITIMKLILEKVLIFALSNHHIELQKTSKQFLDKLFYLKIDRLDEVLIQMNDVLLQKLEKIWKFNKEKMMIKEQQDDNKENQKIISEIKYEHLPLINGKFFGVYQPYILKNIFNPELHSAKKIAIKHFREQFQANQTHLQKYLNVIFKVIIKFLHEQYYDLLFVLKKIISMNGISNIVNLSVLPKLLVGQLEIDVVTYRRDLREILKKLNFNLAQKTLKSYQEQLQGDKMMGWIKLHQILQLLQHWIDHNLEASYPPVLDNFLPIICTNLNFHEVKVRQKSLELLLTILDRYPGYRQNLQEIFSEDRIGEIEDMIEKRKTKNKSNPIAREAEQIFMKEYQQQRGRYIEFKYDNQ